MRLEIKDLHVHYGKIEAIKGISVVVNEGEIVTLIGANGAGKTTRSRQSQVFAKSHQDPSSLMVKIFLMFQLTSASTLESHKHLKAAESFLV